MAVSPFFLFVAFFACLFNLVSATRSNHTLSGSALVGSSVEYNPPLGDPNGWIISPDGIMTTAAGASATFTVHAIGIYAFTNASAGASYTFQVYPYPARPNSQTGPNFVIALPEISLGTYQLTVTNLVGGQRLTIQQVSYIDCVNDELADCYDAPLNDLNKPQQLDYLAGPVAGGVIGGVVLIVGLVLFIYHRRRIARRRAREAARRPLDFSGMQKASPASAAFMSQRDVEAQHALPVSLGKKGMLSSTASASDGSSTSGDDDLKLDDNVLAFTDADIARITAGGPSKASPTTSAGSSGGAWKAPQRPAPTRQQNPKRSSAAWSISSHSDASSR